MLKLSMLIKHARTKQAITHQHACTRMKSINGDIKRSKQNCWVTSKLCAEDTYISIMCLLFPAAYMQSSISMWVSMQLPLMHTCTFSCHDAIGPAPPAGGLRTNNSNSSAIHTYLQKMLHVEHASTSLPKASWDLTQADRQHKAYRLLHLILPSVGCMVCTTNKQHAPHPPSTNSNCDCFLRVQNNWGTWRRHEQTYCQQPMLSQVWRWIAPLDADHCCSCQLDRNRHQCNTLWPRGLSSAHPNYKGTAKMWPQKTVNTIASHSGCTAQPHNLFSFAPCIAPQLHLSCLHLGMLSTQAW